MLEERLLKWSFSSDGVIILTAIRTLLSILSNNVIINNICYNDFFGIAVNIELLYYEIHNTKN